ncbi:MAG: cytochrome b/b6 domain-containing protein [Betaproteobacteria bacterium]|nr:cytochrome b/b6 domain-containing protein [Betaproteobacteria bacterium]
MPPSPPLRRVSDAPTRMFHWSFAACFIGAYLSSESERLVKVHAMLGYSMVALLVFRLLYGCLGPRPVRWSALRKKLQSGWTWWRSLRSVWDLQGGGSRGGQNFALVLATTGLIGLATPLLWSGHVLYTSNADWLEELHETVANTMLLLVVVHLGLLLLVSVWRGSNLALPMWRGRVPGPGPDLITQPRTWLALMLLPSAVAFGVWAVL